MPQTFEERVRTLLANFPENPDLTLGFLGDLLTADPGHFRAAALPAIPGIQDAACRRRLLDLLLKKGLLPACDPAVYSLEQEIAIARELAELDASLDMKLARRFSGTAEAMPEPVAQRVLELLAEVSRNSRVLPLVIKLLHDPNPRLRSKAALVIGRSKIAPHTAERLLSERDPRVRANAVEALWSADTSKTRALLHEAAGDRNNRVAGNAQLGLFRLGDPAVIPRIFAMAAHADPSFRATAAWVMERTGNPRFLPALTRMLRESHPRARSRVFRAIATLNRAASKFAQLSPLRVDILSVSNQADGMRSLRAAIATDAGGEATGLLFTGIVVSENSRMAAGYTVTKPAPPESIAAGLFLPEGSGAGPVIAAVSALKRACDRLSVVRYTPGGSLAGVHQLLGSLEPGGGVRHVFLHADQLSESDPATACQAVVAQARACAARIHSISLRGSAIRYGRMLAGQTGGSATVVETMDEAAAACGKLYLGLLHLYEIAYRTPDRTAAPAEVKLEAYAESGYGAGVMRAAIPSGMA